jgi:hypothetical protein
MTAARNNSRNGCGTMTWLRGRKHAHDPRQQRRQNPRLRLIKGPHCSDPSVRCTPIAFNSPEGRLADDFSKRVVRLIDIDHIGIKANLLWTGPADLGTPRTCPGDVKAK